MARRHPPAIVRFGNLGFTPVQQKKLEELSQAFFNAFQGDIVPHASTHLQGAGDPLQAGAAPLTVRVGGSASAGSGPGYMLGNAQLVVGQGTPVATGDANAAGSSALTVAADHVHQRNVEVLVGGVLVGVERKLNFVSGATAADNPGASRVDVTVTATGGGASSMARTFLMMGA